MKKKKRTDEQRAQQKIHIQGANIECSHEQIYSYHSFRCSPKLVNDNNTNNNEKNVPTTIPIYAAIDTFRIAFIQKDISCPSVTPLLHQRKIHKP